MNSGEVIDSSLPLPVIDPTVPNETTSANSINPSINITNPR